jgi:hypothetical protein
MPCPRTVPQPYNPTNSGRPIAFTATTGDAEDGDGLTHIRWLSRRDGFIGTGVQLTISTLSPGQHLIIAVATDNEGAKGTDLFFRCLGRLLILPIAISRHRQF